MALVEDKPAITADKLPKQIVEVLDRAIRRRRNVILLRGILAVAAVAIGMLLGLMAIDLLVTIVSSTVRWSLTLSALLIVFGSIGWFLVRPLARRMTLVRMAQLVDAHHPEFEERVSSTVELLSARKRRYDEASPMLLEALTNQAVQQVRAVEPRREFNLRSVRPFLAAVCAAVAVWVIIWFAWPTQTKKLLNRVLNPYAQSGNLRAADLEVHPGHTKVGVGDPLRIDATLKVGGAQHATVLQQNATGEELRIPMTRLTEPSADNSNFVVTLPRIAEAMKYRVLVDGGALSEYYSVTVTERPAVTRYDIRYEFPGYTGLQSRTVQNAKGDIVAPVGTTVTLTAMCSKPLHEAKLLLGGKTTAATEIAADGKATWQFMLLPTSSGKWSLALTDNDDLTITTEDHQVQAVPDAAPLVAIAKPEEAELRLKPDDRLPIDYRVREDYGLSSVSFLVRTGSGPEVSVKSSFPTKSSIERGTWVGNAVLDLRTLSLGGAPRIEVLLDVRDTLPEVLGGPQRALSRSIVIIFDANAQDYSAQSAEKSIRKLQTALADALNLLKGAKGQIASVRPTLDKQPLRLTPAGAKAIENSQTQTGQAETLLWKLYEAGEDPELMEHATQAAQIAEKHVTPARQALELIPLAHVKQEQVNQAKVAEDQIDAAIAALEGIIKKLAEEQQRLAKARQLAAELGNLADDQSRLRQATQNAKDKDPKSAEEIAERIRDAQWQIAHEATQLARKIDQSGFNGGTEHREASDFARQAANRLIDKKVNEAIPLGKQAEEKFNKSRDKLAAAPPAQAPQDALDPPFAQAEKQLAERQARVNEQLDALKKGDLAKALESLQKDVAERAKQLAERSEKLPKSTAAAEAPVPKEGNPQGPKDVKMPFKDTVGQAVEKAEMAAADLGHIDNIPKISPPKFVEGPQSPSDGGGSPDGGQGTQGGGSNTGAGSSKGPSPSNNNINNTIAKGKNLGKATLTAEALMNQKPGSNKGPSGGSGTELQKDAEELLRKGLAQIMADNNPEAKGFGGFGGGAPDKDVPPSAPKEFGAEGGEEMPSGEGQSESGEPQGGEPQGGEAKPGGKKAGRGGKLKAGQGRVTARLEELGISGSDWLKLPSDLRNELLQASDDRAPREYRELVRRYFQTMARRSGENK